MISLLLMLLLLFQDLVSMLVVPWQQWLRERMLPPLQVAHQVCSLHCSYSSSCWLWQRHPQQL
jgi:hypothetical protein